MEVNTQKINELKYALYKNALFKSITELDKESNSIVFDNAIRFHFTTPYIVDPKSVLINQVINCVTINNENNVITITFWYTNTASPALDTPMNNFKITLS